MNSYRSVFSIPEPLRPVQHQVEEPAKVEPSTRNFTNDYYRLLTAIDDFLAGRILFTELVNIRKELD